MSKTDENPETAINGEARARLKYTAFALQAVKEGHPEIAQFFLEAAGAENGPRHEPPASGGRHRNDEQNLDESANGENDDIEGMYPRFIREAESDGRTDAVASFRLAVEREKHHRAMFQEAFADFQA